MAVPDLIFRQKHLTMNAAMNVKTMLAVRRHLGMATTYRVEKHKRAVLEQRYFISSADLNAERLSQAVREHWCIENQLHWVLDVSLSEDACQIYRGNAAANLATMRHFGLNMLRAEKRKMSIRRKQRQALMNEAYLDAVLEAGMSVVIK